MLRGLLKREELWAEPLPKPVSPITGPEPCSQPVHPNAAPNRMPLFETRTGVQKQRRTRVQIARLYPETPPEPLKHARALLQLIQTECPHLCGKYIPQSDLARTYRELCAQEQWKPRHWTAIGRRLGKLTDKKNVKRNGSRFVAYRIPRR